VIDFSTEKENPSPIKEKDFFVNHEIASTGKRIFLEQKKCSKTVSF